MATKKVETHEEMIARLQREREAAQLKAKQAKELREARAATFKAKVGLVKERLTPSPVVGEVARGVGTGAVRVTKEAQQTTRKAYEAIQEVRKTPEYQRAVSAVKQVIKTAAAQPLSETYLTLVKQPRGYDPAWNALESAFGYGTFTNLQAIPMLAQALNTDQGTARLRLRALWIAGNVQIASAVRMETRPVRTETFSQQAYKDIWQM